MEGSNGGMDRIPGADNPGFQEFISKPLQKPAPEVGKHPADRVKSSHPTYPRRWEGSGSGSVADLQELAGSKGKTPENFEKSQDILGKAAAETMSKNPSGK